MTWKPTPAYYLMITGGGLTLLTAGVILLSAIFSPFYRYSLISPAPLYPLPSSILTLLPALAVLYFGQRFLTRPETQTESALLVAIMSVISLVGVMGSGAFLYLGLFLSGPPISFVGGLTGALLKRSRDSSTGLSSTT